MTPGEFREFVKTMADFGVSKLKMNGVEIEFSTQPIKESSLNSHFAPSQEPKSKDPDVIKHKTEELASLLKLSDHELVDQLFPDETKEEESA